MWWKFKQCRIVWVSAVVRSCVLASFYDRCDAARSASSSCVCRCSSCRRSVAPDHGSGEADGRTHQFNAKYQLTRGRAAAAGWSCHRPDAGCGVSSLWWHRLGLGQHNRHSFLLLARSVCKTIDLCREPVVCNATMIDDESTTCVHRPVIVPGDNIIASLQNCYRSIHHSKPLFIDTIETCSRTGTETTQCSRTTL